MLEGFPFHFLDDFVIVPQQFGREHLGADVDLALAFCLDIVGLGIDGQGHIGGQRPRCGGPDQEVFIGVGALESHDNRIGLDFLVALGDLVGCQPGAAARAIGQNLMPFINVSLVKEFI